MVIAQGLQLLTKARGVSRILLQSPATLACISMTTKHNKTKHRNFHTSTRKHDTEHTPQAEEPVGDPSLPVVPRRFNLTFEDYIKLKRSLVTKQRIGGVFTGFGSGVACSISLQIFFPHWFIPAATPEDIPLIYGMDPMVVSIGCTALAMGVGYSLGCTTTKGLWSVLNKSKWNDLRARDTDFLARLDKHRFVGESNFEDDYYGETIKNTSDYRQWLRQHQKKRENHEKYELTIQKEMNK